MAELDPHDRLLEECRKADQYPFTLLKNTTSRSLLQWYRDYLLQNDAALFDELNPRLVFWELWLGEQEYQKTELESKKQLQDHLTKEPKDPKCRHIFIESNNSRAPLNCSSLMLKIVLTYHQVDPSFLDSIFTFGIQHEPLDAGLSHFHSDDALAVQERLPFLKSLGRSGRELRHSFLLRSVERAHGSAEQWSIRQVAVFHLFDVVNGRAVWITVKGNNSLQKIIAQDTTDLPVQRGVIEDGIGPSFEASLDTHLIYFRWCDENWRWFVRDMEERIRESLIRARTAPVDREPHFTRAPPKRETNISTYLKRSGERLSSLTDMPEKHVLHWRNPYRRSLPNKFDLAQKPAWEPEQALSDARQVPEGALVLNMFNYNDLQTLSRLSERLEEAILVLQLNVGALEDVYQYYESLARSDEIEDDLKGNLKKSLPPFLAKLRHIIRSLETRQMQLVSLRKRLDEGKVLYGNLLQLRSLQVSRIFAEHGHRSAITMEHIARKTQRETLSMHTVTVVTLVFLPATFLATFFQSGVLQWKETPDIVDQWLFRSDVFRLFMAICVPMTALTLFGWLLVNIFAQIRLRRGLFKDTTGLTLETMVRSPESPA